METSLYQSKDIESSSENSIVYPFHSTAALNDHF